MEIIPNLYLGNAAISAELSILERNNIKHILNVTPDLPNIFESNNIRYLQIPISDHWTQSMLSYFPSAIQFIGKLYFFYAHIINIAWITHHRFIKSRDIRIKSEGKIQLTVWSLCGLVFQKYVRISVRIKFCGCSRDPLKSLTYIYTLKIYMLYMQLLFSHRICLN